MASIFNRTTKEYAEEANGFNLKQTKEYEKYNGFNLQDNEGVSWG